MVDKEKIAKYIGDLEVYITHLEELRKHSLEEVLGDWRLYDLVDRKLHVAIEAFLTIGEMLISEFALPKPETYADVPRILFENKVFKKETADKLEDLARFRNVLVHDYLYLDHEIVYGHLQNDPDILKEAIEAIKTFVRAAE